MAKGLTSEPPKPKQKAQYTRQQRQDFKSGKVADPRANKQPQYAGLNDQQAQVINNTNQADIGLSGYNLGQLPGVYGAYSQPFDQSQLPQSPWSQGQTIQDMEGQYYDRALENYDRSFADQYKQEDLDFEEMAMQRGWTPGSNVYEKEKSRIAKDRASARQGAMDSAYFNAGQNATTWNNLGTQNFQNAYGYQMDQRNRPLSEYMGIQGAISGMPGQNLAGSQAYQLQAQDHQNQRWLMQNAPRGGGSGGGGSQPMWAQYGFTSPQEFDAYRQAQERDNLAWNWANNPQYRQPSGPSYSSQLGGGILGSLATGWALGGFKSPF